MKRRRIVIGLILILIILVLVIPQKSKVEKEIEYYEDEGYRTVEITLTEFYNLLPTDLPTREVEVSKEKLRTRVHLAADLLDIEKSEIVVCYNPDKTAIWALCYTSISDTIGYVEVLFWEP